MADHRFWGYSIFRQIHVQRASFDRDTRRTVPIHLSYPQYDPIRSQSRRFTAPVFNRYAPSCWWYNPFILQRLNLPWFPAAPVGSADHRRAPWFCVPKPRSSVPERWRFDWCPYLVHPSKWVMWQTQSWSIPNNYVFFKGIPLKYHQWAGWWPWIYHITKHIIIQLRMEFRQVIKEPWATPSMATPESCYHVKNKNKHNFQRQSKNQKNLQKINPTIQTEAQNLNPKTI